MGGRTGFLLCALLLCAACGGGGTAALPAAPPAPGGGNPPAPPPAPPPPALTGPPGARSFKSGPIQITADGGWVWAVNTDNDSVTRIDTATDAVTEFVLPDPAQADAPYGVSVTEDGAEVWVACHDSDTVYVLRGSDGAVLAAIALPWGSGPRGIALSRDQLTALVTLYRRGAVAEIDVASRAVGKILEPVWRSPKGIAWIEGEETAWITHVLADGEHTRLTKIDCSGPEPRVAGEVTVFATDPRSSSRLQPPQDVAEGGYLTPRGHPAQRPGRRELWLPMQYNNIHDDRFSPDSTIQTTLRRLELDTLALPNTNATKVILSALHVHEPTGNNAFVGPGWNAGVSGPADLAFSADGQLSYLVCETSNDLVIVPTSTTNVRPAGAPPLAEIAVGDHPVGVAASPTAGALYVLNRFSRDVSVIDVDGARELRRLPATPVTGEPFSAPELLGAKLFHSSTDPRTSGNQKVGCGSCHIDNEIDGRDWGFHRLPGAAGPRPTLTMRGLNRHFGPRDPVTGFGQLHRSGDLDEVQDFDATFRSDLMGGTGFVGAGAPEPLGAPMAGRSADLDAVATYLLGLEPLMRSPHRAPDGSLTERAVRGATLFLQANCDRCHVPESGFVDFGFHDVGSNRHNGEEELNQGSRAPYQWHVNTKTLVGLFATPGYEGVATWAQDIQAFLNDIAGRTSHGDIRNLTAQQRADLGAFLLSVDGDMTAAEVRNAADTTRPRLVRAEATSLTRVDVWFSEPVDRATAESLANWTIRTAPVTAAAWDGQNGDRVTLTTQLAKNTSYTVVPGAVRDAAGNALDTSGTANEIRVDVGATLTITLGASGYENLTIPVHDAGTVGSNLATWSHDRPVLFTNGGTVNKGFVRFDWRGAFVAATGVAAAADLAAASFTLHPQTGHRHPVEARRCLQAWSDPPTGGDWNRNADGGPTWRDHSHPNERWNAGGANRRSQGVEGAAAGDYDGPDDTAFSPDVTADVASITERVTFSGTRVTEAFRFWFANPGLDYGYVLQLAPNAHRAGLQFVRHEAGLKDKGPVLTITFTLP